MNESEIAAVDVFVKQCLQHARNLPTSEAKMFLHGAIILNDREEINPLRQAFQLLNHCDQQLQLLIQTK